MAEVLGKSRRLRGVGGDYLGNGSGREGEPGECWRQVVVQVPAQAPSFLLARQHQALSRLPQFIHDPHTMYRHTCLMCDIVQQSTVARRKPAFAGARADVKLAHSLALIE